MIGKKLTIWRVTSSRFFENMGKLYKTIFINKCHFKQRKQVTRHDSYLPGNLLNIFRTHYTQNTPGRLFGTKYSRMDQLNFFKGCLPQITLGPFLNTLSHL